MVQIRIFVGTIEEIEKAFNGWAASLREGTNVQASPLTAAGDGWIKEVMYLLPLRSNGIAVPAPGSLRAN